MEIPEFPEWVPRIGDMVRVSSCPIDYEVRHYKCFCEEAHVVSRFAAIDYAGNPVIEVTLGGQLITEPLRYGVAQEGCRVLFDGCDRPVEVKKLEDW